MSYYAQQDSGFLSRRAIAFVAIIGLHILAIWAFSNGLLSTGTRFVQTILQTNIVETTKPKDLPPPPPPVELKERPPVQVVAPDINISVPVDTPPPPITNTTTQVVPPAPPPKAPVVIAVPGTPSTAVFPATEDYYPPASQRANEEGRPIVHYCVSAAGKITEVSLKTGSGFDRLDQAAVSLVKAASRIKPATSAGKPVDSCKDVAIKFQLRGN